VNFSTLKIGMGCPAPNREAQIKAAAAEREISEADYLELLVRLAPDV
jgi:hypothetical protein